MLRYLFCCSNNPASFESMKSKSNVSASPPSNFDIKNKTPSERNASMGNQNYYTTNSLFNLQKKAETSSGEEKSKVHREKSLNEQKINMLKSQKSSKEKSLECLAVKIEENENEEPTQPEFNPKMENNKTDEDITTGPIDYNKKMMNYDQDLEKTMIRRPIEVNKKGKSFQNLKTEKIMQETRKESFSDQKINKNLNQENKELKEKIKLLRENVKQINENFQTMEAKYENKKEKLNICESRIRDNIDYMKVISEKDVLIKDLTEAVATLKTSLKETKLNYIALSSPEVVKKANQNSIKKAKEKSIVIKIDSLLAIKKGWEVQKNSLKLEKDAEFLIFGLIGLKNTGKSFLFNKFNDSNLNEEDYFPTNGLNILKLQDSNTICLDSEGIGSAAEYFSEAFLDKLSIKKEEILKNDELNVQLMTDRILTDLFLNDLICEMSNIFIIVVDFLNQKEQKLIERARNTRDVKKKIIIIHNFKTISSRENLDFFIEKYVKNCFNVIPSIIPQTETPFFIEKSDNNKENILHFILAKENSEAGKLFNPATFEHLKKILDTNLEKRKFDFSSDFINFFEDNFRRYFKFLKPVQNVSLSVGKDRVFLDFNGDFQVANSMFNDYLPRTTTNPSFDVFELKDKYQCFIEISDLETKVMNLFIEKRKTGLNLLVIKGMKRTRKIDEIENVMGNRKTGEFVFEIPLGENKITLEKDIKYEYKKGVLFVQVGKKVEEEEVDL